MDFVYLQCSLCKGKNCGEGTVNWLRCGLSPLHSPLIQRRNLFLEVDRSVDPTLLAVHRFWWADQVYVVEPRNGLGIQAEASLSSFTTSRGNYKRQATTQQTLIDAYDYASAMPHSFPPDPNQMPSVLQVVKYGHPYEPPGALGDTAEEGSQDEEEDDRIDEEWLLPCNKKLKVCKFTFIAVWNDLTLRPIGREEEEEEE